MTRPPKARTVQVIYWLVLTSLAPRIGASQIVDVGRPTFTELKARGVNIDSKAVEAPRLCAKNNQIRILERGLFDAFSSGLLQASGQLVRLCVGQPSDTVSKKVDDGTGGQKDTNVVRRGFLVPLYFLVGAAQNVAGDPESDATAEAAILNPVGGVVNLFFQREHQLLGESGFTRLSLSWQAGARYVASAALDSSNKGISLVVGDFRAGVLFQTGAWDLDDPDPTNAGVLWLLTRVAASVSSSQKYSEVFGGSVGSVIASLALESGIEIKNRITVKLSFYQPLTRPAGTVLETGVVKFGFDVKTGK